MADQLSIDAARKPYQSTGDEDRGEIRRDHMEAIENPSRRIPELDGVRGIACIFIILLHCLIGVAAPTPGSIIASIRDASMPFLVGGVDLFFVLSGFLIGGVLIDNRKSGNFFRAFWTRRVARIFPVNYVLIASYTLALLIQGTWHFPQLDIFALAEPIHSPLWYATFSQSIPLALTDWGPKWMGITWSLAIEEQFYLLFPFAVYFLSRRRLVVLSISAIVLAPILFVVVATFFGRFDTAYVLLPCRMYGLFLGVLVACVVRNEYMLSLAQKYRLPLDLAALLLVYAIHSQWFFLGTVFQTPTEFLQLSIMFALLLLRVFLYNGGIFRAILRSQLLTRAGLISYALYMYHQSINGVLHGFVFNQAPRIASLSELALGLLIVAISVGLATLSYLCLERPFLRWGHRVRFEKEQATISQQGERLANATVRL